MGYPWQSGEDLTATDLNAAVAQGLAQTTIYQVSGSPPSSTVGAPDDWAVDMGSLTIYTKSSGGAWNTLGFLIPSNPSAASLPTGF